MATKCRSHAYSTVFLLAAACIFAIPVPGSAFPAYTYARADTSVGDSFNSPVFDAQVQDHSGNILSTAQASGALSGSDSWGTASEHTEARASAEIGRLRLFAQSSGHATNSVATLGGVGANARGTAQARWDDNFTIDGGPLLNGQMGHLVAGFSVDGFFIPTSWDASVAVNAVMDQYFRASLRLVNPTNDVTVHGGQQHLVNSSGNIWVGPFGEPLLAPGVWPIEIDFIFGTPIQVSGWGDIKADAFAYALYTAGLPVSDILATVNFGATMAWNGISSITDSLGNPVTSYTLSSGSGFDYRYGATSAVPEPSTLLLLGAGLAGLLFLWRKGTA